MEKLMEQMNAEMVRAFTACGYDGTYARVTMSNRPDLCEFQCNGALAAAKQYKKSPLVIAQEIVAELSGRQKILETKRLQIRGRSSLTTAGRILQSRCMLDICVLRLLERASSGWAVMQDIR